MEGWTVPSTHLPPGPAQPEATVSCDLTSTFFRPIELNLSPEDQLRRWAQLEQLQFIQEQNCQEQVIHGQFCLQQQIHPELISQEQTSVIEDPVCQEEPYFEASQLPQDPDMGRRKQAVAPVAVSQVEFNATVFNFPILDASRLHLLSHLTQLHLTSSDTRSLRKTCLLLLLFQASVSTHHTHCLLSLSCFHSFCINKLLTGYIHSSIPQSTL